VSDGRKAVRVAGRLEVQDSIWPDVVLAGGQTLAEKFVAFHAANPWVFTALEQMVADDLNLGQTVGGIRMYWEVLRWRYNRRTVGSVFKVDNNLTSHYVRALVEAHPEWSTYFKQRELRAA
jgi:hypothetical protein